MEDNASLYGVAVVGDEVSRELQKLKETGMEDNASLYGVAVVGDEVMVCNIAEGDIMVYSKEMKFTRRIKIHNRSFIDVSGSEHGNLYSLDHTFSRVCVLTNGDELLHSFDGDGRDVGEPLGIHRTDQYVYVVNRKNHNVSVFTTEKGEHVTSFGRNGGNAGEFSRPAGICTDKDGFVYVCDYGNNRARGTGIIRIGWLIIKHMYMNHACMHGSSI